MINQQIKTIERNDMTYHLLPTKKFKTITFIIKLKAPLERETVTKRALIPFLLKQGTATYHSEQLLMQKLDELYGATLHIDCMKKGSNHIIHLQLEVANERFIQGEEQIVTEALRLLEEIIFSPVIEDGAFPKAIIESEKRKLTNKINAIKDNKILYANQRLLDHMYEGESFSIHKDGYSEELQKIDGKSLYEYYQQILRRDQIDLYVIGDFNVEEMEEKVSTLIQRDQWNRYANDAPIEHKTISSPNVVSEHEAIQQAKLHIGYRTNCTIRDDRYAALQLFNGLFGGYPSSRLFMNVREKNSLAYYIASRVESHQGLLLVYSGIEAQDAKKTIDIIEAQREEIINGSFSYSEMEEIKKLIISNLYETFDHITGTVELFYQLVVANASFSLSTFIEQIQAVTMEDVQQVANQIQLDTVYILANEEGVLS